MLVSIDRNTLERYYLNSIKYDVSVNASNYARAYFDLRKISDNRVVGINRRKSIKPLNLKEALKLNVKESESMIAESY